MSTGSRHSSTLLLGVLALCAVSETSRSAEISPSEVASAVERGHRRLAAQDYDKALDSFARALELSGGTSSEAALGLARTNREIGRFRDALTAARQALATAPDPRTRAEAHLEVGRIFFWGWPRMELDETGALETAQEELGLAIEQLGEAASPAHGPRAAALYQLGRKQEAAETLAGYRGAAGEEYDLGEEIRCFLEAEATSPPANPKAAAEAGAEVVKPKKRRAPRASYPAAAREHEEQGLVLVQALIGKSGDVECLRPVKGLPFGLTNAALSAVRRWQYDPATVNGQPVSVYYDIAVSFFLR